MQSGSRQVLPQGQQYDTTPDRRGGEGPPFADPRDLAKADPTARLSLLASSLSGLSSAEAASRLRSAHALVKELFEHIRIGDARGRPEGGACVFVLDIVAHRLQPCFSEERGHDRRNQGSRIQVHFMSPTGCLLKAATDETASRGWTCPVAPASPAGGGTCGVRR